MGKRSETRLSLSLQVSVSGLDYFGNPFTQSAQTIDISRHGIRVAGVACLRQAGDMITIRHGAESAPYLVVWIGNTARGEFGAKLLQSHQDIFHLGVTGSEPDTYNCAPMERPPSPEPPAGCKPSWDNNERRAWPRYQCSGTGQVIQTNTKYPVWATLSDLSASGCYLEMVFAVPKDTHIALKLTVNNKTFVSGGEVVTSHSGVGIGVRFTGMSSDDLSVLKSILDELARLPAVSADASILEGLTS